ncbi:ricin B lectin domain-containing protein [Jimgerdemannia flammicorona]|uniref:Ricin B lectin domain-containing protein n=1 Tax=Jimgerdemannia flammicorona TaxID=994334 RepID=A0A433CZB2_9FUNG|nr:ricin B lectin domain-containing protein [Jimgerdemannia flammicorona]
MSTTSLRPIEEFPQGFFYIKSRKNGMVLDVEGDSKNPNARVIVWPQKFRANDNQLWSYDDGYLTNKNSGLDTRISDRICIPTDQMTAKFLFDTQIIQSDRKLPQEVQYQRWYFCEEGFFYPLQNSHLVLDIKGDSDEKGTPVLLYQRKDTENYNQLWTIEPYPFSSETFSLPGQEGYSYSYV